MGVSLSFDKDRDLPIIVGIEKKTPASEAGLQVANDPAGNHVLSSRSFMNPVHCIERVVHDDISLAGVQ